MPNGSLRGMQFDKTINLGNLVSWAVIGIGFVVTINTNLNQTSSLQKSFDERKVYVDTQLAKGAEALGLSQINARELAAQKVTDDKQDQRLDLGYKDRTETDRGLAREMAEIRKDQALTSAKVDALERKVDRLLEKQEGRRDGVSPFGENQTWDAFPWTIPPPPPILKATLSEPQARPFRAARRGGKRRGVMLVGLTRSLERSFGRPYWKRRTWP